MPIEAITNCSTIWHVQTATDRVAVGSTCPALSPESPVWSHQSHSAPGSTETFVRTPERSSTAGRSRSPWCGHRCRRRRHRRCRPLEVATCPVPPVRHLSTPAARLARTEPPGVPRRVPGSLPHVRRLVGPWRRTSNVRDRQVAVQPGADAHAVVGESLRYFSGWTTCSVLSSRVSYGSKTASQPPSSRTDHGNDGPSLYCANHLSRDTALPQLRWRQLPRL